MRHSTLEIPVMVVAALLMATMVLAGYAVECGLKACIARLTNRYDFPDKDRTQRSYTHRIEVLIDVAGLGSLIKVDATANPVRAENWLLVKDWDEGTRYLLWTELHARDLFRAVSDSTNGVLQWIKGHW